jgi:predicted esterase
MSPRLTLALFVVPALALVAASAARADAPPVAALRSRLAVLAANRPEAVPEGTLTSIGYMVDTAERIENRFAPQSESWRRRAAGFLDRVEAGHDPYPEQRGKIVSRAYVSPISQRRQGYTIYVPPGYDPSRAYPLMIVLHGGSSNGNLFLGVVLGNNMSWLEYDRFLWNDFEPQWTPDWIIVAPDGYGQVMWRWMGEQDVLDVLADVERHYRIDPERVHLNGVSNGGLGTHNIGMRHAWRFATVIPMAGAPSWQQYTGSRQTSADRTVLASLSGMQLLENAWNTDYRYHHGRSDPGPMRPAFIEELDAEVARLGVPARGTWYDAGHDLLYIVHRHGRFYEQLANVRRKTRPAEVTLLSGDYRAARQHWLTVTRIENYPVIARLHAKAEADAITVETRGARAFSIDLREVPLAEGENARIVVDGAEAWSGPRAALGHVVHLVRGEGGWRTGFPPQVDGLEKRPGLSGPMGDAYYGRMVHVYGTQIAENTATLRRVAERGARGWPLWLWSVSQEVVPDTAVDDAMMRSATLVLYGGPGDNAVLERMQSRLPIRVEPGALVFGERRFTGNEVGTRFIHPNPLAPDQYVIVQAGVTAKAAAAGHNLPDFLPDYVVYDGAATRERQRLVMPRAGTLALGFFDDRWAIRPDALTAAADGARVPSRASVPAAPRARGGAAAPVPEAETITEGGDDGPTPRGLGALHTQYPLDLNGEPVVPQLPIPAAPPPPPRPTEFLAGDTDPVGKLARVVARRIASFRNFRADIPGATWQVDPGIVWKFRPRAACLPALGEAGVPFLPLPEEQAAQLTTPVPAPVVVLPRPIGGVTFTVLQRRDTEGEDRLVLSCELAARLPAIATVLARHGVTRVEVLSAYRNRPRPSFHTFGLALDLASFTTPAGRLRVATDFEVSPAHETCSAPPPASERARLLQRIACDLAQSRHVSTVLTPNYNAGHRDHFHVDVRPDDPRLFVR